MKKITALLLMFCLTASAQITITLPKQVVSEARLKQYGDSLAAAIRASISQSPPVVELPKCKEGPEIRGISKISSNSITVLWHGDEVYKLFWEIYNPQGVRVFADTINPTGNTLVLYYPVLGDGTYTLTFKGRSCTGTDSRKFTIKSTSQGPDTIVAPPPVPDIGNFIPKRLNVPLPQNMNIVVSKVGDQWMFSDMSERGPPPAGYEYWYGVNGVIYKQSVPLRNIAWPANTPLGIWKAQARLGLSTLAKWTPDGTGWFDPNAGAGFDYNDSFPFTSYLFQKSGTGYDTTRLVSHWMDVMPDMKVPPGNVWIMPLGHIDTPDFLMRKGVTHFSKFEVVNKPYWGQLLSAGKLYDEVPQTPSQFNLQDRGARQSNWVPTGVGWPNNWNERFFGEWDGKATEPGSYQQGFDAGSRYPVDLPIVIFENTEQDHALAAHWPIVRGFYDAFMPRIKAFWESKGVKPLVAHNYFTTFSGGPLTLGFSTRQANKDILRTPYALWPNTGDLGIRGTLNKTTAVCFGIYLGSPDSNTEVAYRMIFSFEVAKEAGFAPLAFIQPFAEFRPNNLQRQIFPEGEFYMHTKQGWNPADGISYSFLAQCFGRGLIPFSAASKTPKDFSYDRDWRGNGSLWKQNGSKSYEQNSDKFPYWMKPGKGERYQGGQSEYYIAEGVRYYNDYWLLTHGGERKFLKFRVDGGKWIEVANRNMDDLVDAFFDKRGFVYSQKKGNLLSVFYLNSFADNSLHKLEYEYEGKIYSTNIHSTIVHPELISLN